MKDFMIIYLIILGGGLILGTLIVIGMKWLYEKRKNK
jgi:hypothetical protein